MHYKFSDLIKSRVSVNFFDATRDLSDYQVETLIHLATCAPTAFNLQNWKFIVVRSTRAKKILKSVAFEQQKILDASVNIIICGVLNAYEELSSVLQPSVDAGLFEQAILDRWVEMAYGAHHGNQQLQRDEGIRSASLAAMNIMLAAEEMGLVTCPISGFDEEGVKTNFELSVVEIPIIIISVGYEALGNWQQKIRKPLAQIMTIV